MSRRLHMAYAESFIAISRSVSLQFRYMNIPALLLIILPMFRSRQVAPKTAIQVSTVVRGASPCKTCEHVMVIERVRCDSNRQHRIQVLAGLTDNSRSVLIPGFCTYLSLFSFLRALTVPHPAPLRADDKVRPLDDGEAALFRLLESVTQRSAASLMSRWREPSLTIHGVRGSGPHNPTVIPASVTAQVSLRIVPDQVLDTVGAELIQHLRASFDALNSANTIKVENEKLALFGSCSWFFF